MNRNGATNGGLPENLYIALAMGDRPRVPPHPGVGGGMVPAASNDPAVLLAHYQHLPKDEVDWAAVAQQWIKMRESWMQTGPSRIPSPPPPPSFDRDDPVPNGGSSTSTRTLEYAEEQGEAPMEVEWDDDDNLPAPPMPPVISGSDWPGAQASGPAEPALQHWHPAVPVPYEPPAPISRPGPTPTPTPTPSGAPPTNHPQISGSASAALEQWRAKNSHLFQSGGAAAVSSQPPSQPVVANHHHHHHHHQHHRPHSGGRHSGRLPDRDLKGSRGSTASPGHDTTTKDGHGAATINEAKRQLLPAWIREALERMERDKQRQLERELEHRQRAKELESRQASYYELSPVREEPEHQKRREPSPLASPLAPAPVEPAAPAAAAPEVPGTAPESRAIDIQKKTKQILTEILLEATDELLTAVAKETVGRVQKRKAKQAVTVRSQTGLATCTRGLGLGLGIYGDSDEEDEDNEEEQAAAAADGTKKSNAGADNGGSDDNGGSERNSTDDELSDAEAMQRLKEKIKIKQRDFKATASSIEQWLEEATENPDAAGGGGQKHAPAAASLPPDQEQSDDEAESDSGDAAPSQECVVGGRKRREKRVSRFSDPRDTVRQTYITHVSIVSGSAGSKAAPGGGSAPSNPVAAVATPKPTKAGPAPQPQQPPVVQPSAQPYHSHYITRPGKPTMMIYSIPGERKGDAKVVPGPATDQAARDLELSRRLTATGSGDGTDPTGRGETTSTTGSSSSKGKRTRQHRYRSPDSTSDSRSSTDHSPSRSHGTRSRSRSGSHRRSSKHHRRDSGSRRHGHERSRSRDSSRSRHRHRRERSRWSRSRSRSRSRGSSSSKYSSSHRRF